MNVESATYFGKQLGSVLAISVLTLPVPVVGALLVRRFSRSDLLKKVAHLSIFVLIPMSIFLLLTVLLLIFAV